MAAYLAIQLSGSKKNLTGSEISLFDEAAQFLGAGASAAQRAALYSFMAMLPDVVNYGPTTTLGTGIQGTAIGIPGHDGEVVEAVIDTSTSDILELRVTIADPTQYPTGLAGGWNVIAGEVESYTDYVDCRGCGLECGNTSERTSTSRFVAVRADTHASVNCCISEPVTSPTCSRSHCPV